LNIKQEVMANPRNPLAITFDVWRAIFLREALDRLFDMRAAWFWLLMEPVMHIGFITALFTVVRLHHRRCRYHGMDYCRHAGIFPVSPYGYSGDVRRGL
jgi:hypothetical protein